MTAKWILYRETGNLTQNYARSGNVTFGCGSSGAWGVFGSFEVRDEYEYR